MTYTAQRILAIKELRARCDVTLRSACSQIDRYMMANAGQTYENAVAALTRINPPRLIEDEHQALRLQLAACHEAIGSALALLRQEQTSAAMLVLDDALKGKAR